MYPFTVTSPFHQVEAMFSFFLSTSHTLTERVFHGPMTCVNMLARRLFGKRSPEEVATEDDATTVIFTSRSRRLPQIVLTRPDQEQEEELEKTKDWNRLPAVEVESVNHLEPGWSPSDDSGQPTRKFDEDRRVIEFHKSRKRWSLAGRNYLKVLPRDWFEAKIPTIEVEDLTRAWDEDFGEQNRASLQPNPYRLSNHWCPRLIADGGRGMPLRMYHRACMWFQDQKTGNNIPRDFFLGRRTPKTPQPENGTVVLPPPPPSPTPPPSPPLPDIIITPPTPAKDPREVARMNRPPRVTKKNATLLSSVWSPEANGASYTRKWVQSRNLMSFFDPSEPGEYVPRDWFERYEWDGYDYPGPGRS